MKHIVRNLLITLILGGAYFYVALPALNPQSPDFYSFIVGLCIVYIILTLISRGFTDTSAGLKNYLKAIIKNCKIPAFIAVITVLVAVLGSATSWKIIRAKDYQSLIEVKQGDFSKEVAEISFDKIPVLDKDSAQRLGDRKLGELSEMVSQFEVSDDYTQINLHGKPVRVTTLEYADVIKWLTNRSEGLPAYIVIDMTNQNTEVVRVEDGIKYSPSEHFGRNIYRHLRFNYPTFMFAAPTFEIDENDNPYWVCPRVVKRIGLFGGTDIQGGVLVNAITGECEYYEEVPSWVDRLYPADLIVEQYDYYGAYINGFWNYIFGQKGVTQTTSGYNYIAMNDDVYMYTGVTSTGNDQSNVGFLLSNQRTKETKYYSCAGATETSAMASAQGIVQHLKYSATFPLLLNVSGEPTYFVALKDNAQLVKMYAMVNVRQYQLVATGTTVAECEREYTKLLASNNLAEDIEIESTTVSGKITQIKTAVINGNTRYYLRLEGNEKYYAVNVSENEDVITLSEGDMVKIEYSGEGRILAVISIERE